MQHCQHGYVGLASPSRSADQQVLVAVECCWVDAALDAVQCPAYSTHVATGADMLAEAVAVEGCWVDAALDAVQCPAHSTYVATGADMLAEVVAVEGFGPDAALDAVQHSEDSTYTGDRRRNACRIGCC